MVSISFPKSICSLLLRFSLSLPRFDALSIIGLLGLSLLACGDTQGGEIEVTEPRLVQTPEGRRAFTGTLVNGGTRPVSIAQVEMALYDENGSPVETIRFEVKDIPAQDSVSFSSTIDSDRSFRQAQVQKVYTP